MELLSSWRGVAWGSDAYGSSRVESRKRSGEGYSKPKAVCLEMAVARRSVPRCLCVPPKMDRERARRELHNHLQIWA
jgi:hypothetical protein